MPAEHAKLAHRTLAAVLPGLYDPALAADKSGLRDVLLFLYISPTSASCRAGTWKSDSTSALPLGDVERLDALPDKVRFG